MAPKTRFKRGGLVNHDERCEEETVELRLVERTKKIVKLATVAVPSCFNFAFESGKMNLCPFP